MAHFHSLLCIINSCSGTSLQKQSGMAHIVEGFLSFTHSPTCLSTNEMNRTCQVLIPRWSWSSFTDPGGMQGWVGLGTTTVSKQCVQDRYVTPITVVTCTSHHASLCNWSTGFLLMISVHQYVSVCKITSLLCPAVIICDTLVNRQTHRHSWNNLYDKLRCSQLG